MTSKLDARKSLRDSGPYPRGIILWQFRVAYSITYPLPLCGNPSLSIRREGAWTLRMPALSRRRGQALTSLVLEAIL